MVHTHRFSLPPPALIFPSTWFSNALWGGLGIALSSMFFIEALLAHGMNKLHVNGLPLEVTDQHLRDLFAQFGPVSSAKVVRGLDGSSLGFGMVQMSFAED